MLHILLALACSCPKSIGANAGAPPLIEASGFVACGYLDSRDGDVVRASEFDVFACGSDVPLVELGATQTALLRSRDGGLEIVEVANWPFGDEWKWIDVQIWRYVVKPGQPFAVTKTFILEAPRITRRDVEAAKDREELIGRLLAAALSGSASARTALIELRPKILPGHDAEVYAEAVETYQLYAKSTKRVPPLPDF
jgi:hypothetical protein